MKEETRESLKIIVLAVALFFSCVAYGQTEPATTEQATELPRAEEIKQPPTSQPERIDLGRIGVVFASFKPQACFYGKPRTKGDVASDYAKQGAELMLGMAMAGGAAGLGGLMLTPVAAITGAIFGAVRGVSEGTIKETEDTLNGRLSSLDLQGAFRDHLVVVSAEQSRHSLVFLDLRGPSARGEIVVYDVPSYPGIDTVLEIAVESCDLTGGPGVNPDFSLSVGGQIRFLSAKDGKVLSARQIGCSGNTTYKFTEWARNNAQPFKDEIDRVLPCLANRIIEEASYLEENPPEDQSEKQDGNEGTLPILEQDSSSLQEV